MLSNVLEIRHQLVELIQAADRRSANKLMDEWAKDHGYKQAVLELLEPAIEKFGELWERHEDISLAQGYIAAKIAEDVMLISTQGYYRSRSGTWRPFQTMPGFWGVMYVGTKNLAAATREAVDKIKEHEQNRYES